MSDKSLRPHPNPVLGKERETSDFTEIPTTEQANPPDLGHGALIDDVRRLIEASRIRVAQAVNTHEPE
jgi:hypothetical protein